MENLENKIDVLNAKIDILIKFIGEINGKEVFIDNEDFFVNNISKKCEEKAKSIDEQIIEAIKEGKEEIEIDGIRYDLVDLNKKIVKNVENFGCLLHSIANTEGMIEFFEKLAEEKREMNKEKTIYESNGIKITIK